MLCWRENYGDRKKEARKENDPPDDSLEQSFQIDIDPQLRRATLLTRQMRLCQLRVHRGH